MSTTFKSAPVQALTTIFHYHAHVYYDAATREQAMLLRERVAQRFAVDMGRLFEQAVGPLPCAQYEIGFEQALFGSLVPWLMLNRLGLPVLVHPNTDAELADHVDHTLWLGGPLALRADSLAVSLQAQGQSAPRPVVINTAPLQEI